MARINPKTGKPYVTNKKMPIEESVQKLVASVIHKINQLDKQFTPKEQQALIKSLLSLTREQMKAVDKKTGPGIADAIIPYLSDKKKKELGLI